MTDVHEIESPPADDTAATSRRRRRPRAASAGGATTAARRTRLRGADLIESLRESVEQLIEENRSLKRQLAKATAGGASSVPGAERTLRSIQRKVLRAVGSDAPSRRRSRASATSDGRRRRSTRRTSAESSGQ